MLTCLNLRLEVVSKRDFFIQMHSLTLPIQCYLSIVQRYRSGVASSVSVLSVHLDAELSSDLLRSPFFSQIDTNRSHLSFLKHSFSLAFRFVL